MLPVETAFKIYTDLDGNPLDNGYVYFGQANQNPTTAPVTVFWDAAGTQPAAQPLRTLNGYIVRNGTPANVFYTGAYSQLVQDKKRRQVYYARNSDDYSIATVVSNFLSSIASSAGSSLMGFIQAGANAVLRTVQAELRRTVHPKQFGALGGGNDDTLAIQRTIDYAISAGKSIKFERDSYLISSNIVIRSDSLIIDGSGSSIILGSNTAGFSIAGSHNHFQNFKFSQSSQSLTPLAVKIFNDVTTGLSIHDKVSNCYFTDVYRCIQVLMAVNGSGKAAYRAEIKDCEMINKYLQKIWAGSFGVSFDGPNAGDAGGNDSKCVNCFAEGYEKNYLVKNSVSTQFQGCSGDGAAACFSYEDSSTGLQIIGGYYEFNDSFINVVGVQKYDCYIVYPSYANNTAAITGAGIQFIFGGMYAGAPFVDIANGAFKTYSATGVAEIYASNGLKVYTDNAKLLRFNMSPAGECTFSSGQRILVTAPGWVVADRVEGYSGGATPLDLKAGNTITMTTGGVERVRVNINGNILSPFTFSSTTASAANMFVAADGTFQRSTSSAKYKTSIEPLDESYAEKLMQMEPVWYRSTCENDKPEWSWYGLIAEDLAAIDPRFVHWGYSKYKTIETAPAIEARAAVIGEDGEEAQPATIAQEAQYRIEPDTESEMIPEGVMYERLTVFLIAMVQDQQKRIEKLEA